MIIFDILKLTQGAGSDQGVSKRCRLSWLTNSALVYEPKCGWRGELKLCIFGEKKARVRVFVHIRRKVRENYTHCPTTRSVQNSDYTGEIRTAWTFCGKKTCFTNLCCNKCKNTSIYDKVKIRIIFALDGTKEYMFL